MTYELFARQIELDPTRIAESRHTIREQLAEYENGRRRQFELTFDFTDGFTGEVHRELCTIAYGDTRTYGQIAERLGTAPIAVGQACARNPIPVVIPCHRVVGTDSLGGYIYPGLKEKLLNFEQANTR